MESNDSDSDSTTPTGKDTSWVKEALAKLAKKNDQESKTILSRETRQDDSLDTD